MPRPRSVLSPAVERAPKTTPAESKPVLGWRARPRRLDAMGMRVPALYGTEDECLAWATDNADLHPIVERLIGGVYSPRPRDVPTVEELVALGMAKRTSNSNAYTITPTGQGVLADAMVGRDE